jgi:murein DD-endopeptidase MepM/ murein hydrolase activator NlpD
MIKSSINLPFGRRLDFNLVKDRRGKDDLLLPEIKSWIKIRKGNKVSRIFSKIFEKKRIRGVLGKNLLFIMLTTAVIPQSLHAQTELPETKQYIESPLVIETKAGVDYPVKTTRITQNYGLFHPGIDFDGVTGDPIYPITVGRVDKIEYSKFGYGSHIYIDHGNGTKSLYAHLSKIYVSEGDIVSTDTVLGAMGATGRAFGDHLHLEVYENEKRINPLTLLQ